MRRLLLVCLSVLLIGACRSDESTHGGAADGDTPIVYVAIGASDTTGEGLPTPEEQAWPRVFLRTHLPPDTQFTSLGVSGSTVAQALRQQLPRALELEPTLATVWLNVNDMTKFVPVATYEAQLRELVRALRRGGKATVLVANVPALDALPVVSRLGVDSNLVKQAVSNYNDVIGQVVVDEGAVLVDLHMGSLAARATGKERDYVGPDGFHPSAVGHEAIAGAFGISYRLAGNLAK